MQGYFKSLWIQFLACLVLTSGWAFAKTPIQILKTKHAQILSESTLTQQIRDSFNVDQYRLVRVQVIVDNKGNADHAVIYLHSKTFHKVEVAMAKLNAALRFTSVQYQYRLQPEDYEQQPGIAAADAKCPDDTIEFISLCPNNDDLELQITKQVADAAKAANLKTVEITLADATRENYLNYMACPKLRGNFYDGDANPNEITTYDGVITASDISTVLKGKFNYNVTNIWLACEAFNKPMLPAVIDDAQAKKYAAGINDLLVGPSDKAAACAMEAALAGKPMKDSFDACYKQLDDPSDHWGYGGKGSDDFYK